MRAKAAAKKRPVTVKVDASKKTKASVKKEARLEEDFRKSAMHCNSADATKDLDYVVSMIEAKPMSVRFLASMMRQGYFTRLVSFAARRELGSCMNLGPLIGGRAKAVLKIKTAEKKAILASYAMDIKPVVDPALIDKIFKFVHQFTIMSKLPDGVEFRRLNPLACATRSVYDSLNCPLKDKKPLAALAADPTAFDVWKLDGQTVTSKLTGEIAVLNHKTTSGALFTWQIEDAARLESFVVAREDDAIRIETRKLFPRLKDFSRTKFEDITFDDIKEMLEDEDFSPPGDEM